ncbi:MAG: helix-hairpin-helix domain-containing protein [Phycisphaerae bacterium]|nr:helix-hairpin-helix domain-containing protein [Gemmatimonadaceae bacterium]
MPTAAERQALAFLTGVALLGGSVQVWRTRTVESAAAARPAVVGAETVDEQLHAVDSARSSRTGKKKSARKGMAVTRAAGATPVAQFEAAPLLIDVDVAAARELELLPRVGPALAARIVADRDSLGAFGSLEEFGRVRGVGPAMLKLLEPVTTFSGRARSHTQTRHRK